jgi:hypothetical protein
VAGPSDHCDIDYESAPREAIAEWVARHKVRLSVYRDYGPDEHWAPQAVGYNVELRALVLGEPLHITEEAIRAVYDAVRRIGAWAFRVLDDNVQVAYELDEFDQHVVDEGSLLEVELFGHVYHRDDVRRPVDEAELRAVDQVCERLRSVGVRT